MKYTDSITQSAEHLRLAIQYMTKQDAALHPVSYAIWYEYASGINAALNKAIDEKTSGGHKLDEQETYKLFRQFIAEIDEQTAERVTNGFQRILAEISQSASETGDEAQKFGSALEQWTENIGSGQTEGLQLMLKQTQSMHGAIGALTTRLADSHREIEQLRTEVKKAREFALTDGLTGLFNRKGFDLALAACIEDKYDEERGLSLLITDIDFFKKVNDTYGHLLGDKVIQAVAKILKDNIKGKDTAARFGGEEFVVLLPETSIEGASNLAEKIRAAVEKLSIKRSDNNEAIGSITVSLGVTNFRKGELIDEFISRADKALYQSKNEGRNRVSLIK